MMRSLRGHVVNMLESGELKSIEQARRVFQDRRVDDNPKIFKAIA